VIIGVSHVTSEAAMGWGFPVTQDAAARCGKAVEDQLDLTFRCDVVGESEGAWTEQTAALHVGFQPALKPRSKNEAIHLIEGNLAVVEDWRPAEAICIEPLGAVEINDAV
jgi:hypothetical protein